MGREKTREGGEKRGRTFGQEGWPGLNGSELGATGAELGAKIYGAELGARDAGAETCQLGASIDGAELRVQILKSFRQGRICEKLLKNG